MVFIYKDYFISVWCFFAALLSVSVIYVLVSVRRKAATGPSIGHSPH